MEYREKRSAESVFRGFIVKKMASADGFRGEVESFEAKALGERSLRYEQKTRG